MVSCVKDELHWVRHKGGEVCPQNQNMLVEDWCNEVRTPQEVDIRASEKPKHVSYITKKPMINMVCAYKLQNKERERERDTT